MAVLHVNGGKRVYGTVKVSGNKNAVLPMIAAALLTDEEVVLENVPDILDVKVMLDAAGELGARVSFGGGILRIKAANIKKNELDCRVCSRIRASILFAAPLLYRTGRCVLWPPGGDVIGRRRLDGHFYGLRSLGASIQFGRRPYVFERKHAFRGRELFLDEASVTATEQIIIAAVLAEGVTVVKNAASEPHVTSLAEMLIKMGANINGLGTNTLTVTGVDKLCGTVHRVDGDHIEAGSFLALAAATGGEITVEGIVSGHFWMMRRVFERFGIKFTLEPDRILMKAEKRPAVLPDAGNAVPVVADGPWPQFPTDMMSCMIVTATQAAGTVLFFEKMFESRMYFVDRLIAMGGNAIVCDPHRVVISGPATLRPTEMSSPDIRAGMALIAAALCANGHSVIRNAEVIFRGYENITEKLNNIGADVELARD